MRFFISLRFIQNDGGVGPHADVTLNVVKGLMQNRMQKQLPDHCLTIAWLSLNNRFAWLMHEILHFTSFHSEWRWSRASCRRHPERSEGSHAESHAKTTACPLLDHRLTTAWLSLDHCLTTAWPSLGYRLTTAWPSLDYCLTTAWPLLDYCLTTAWQSNHFF